MNKEQYKQELEHYQKTIGTCQDGIRQLEKKYTNEHAKFKVGDYVFLPAHDKEGYVIDGQWRQGVVNSVSYNHDYDTFFYNGDYDEELVYPCPD